MAADAYMYMIKFSHHWFRQWFGAKFLSIIGTHIKWTFKQNTKIIFQENALEFFSFYLGISVLNVQSGTLDTNEVNAANTFFSIAQGIL